MVLPGRRAFGPDETANACQVGCVIAEGECWWTAGGSNSRPPRCERGALPAELAAHFVGCTHLASRTRIRAQARTASVTRHSREPQRAADLPTRRLAIVQGDSLSPRSAAAATAMPAPIRENPTIAPRPIPPWPPAPRLAPAPQAMPPRPPPRETPPSTPPATGLGHAPALYRTYRIAIPPYGSGRSLDDLP